MPPFVSRRVGRALARSGAGIALLAACNKSPLPPATYTNVVDTVTLYALTTTDFTTPSAYSMVPPAGQVRTDQSASFDFAFDIDTLARAVLLPRGAVKLPTSSGLQRSSETFALLTKAPTEGYKLDTPVVVDTGAVVLARSRIQTCLDGSQLGLYAKIHVLAVDHVQRTIQFEILTNQNCGYFGLAPGLPDQ